MFSLRNGYGKFVKNFLCFYGLNHGKCLTCQSFLIDFSFILGKDSIKNPSSFTIKTGGGGGGGKYNFFFFFFYERGGGGGGLYPPLPFIMAPLLSQVNLMLITFSSLSCDVIESESEESPLKPPVKHNTQIREGVKTKNSTF